MRSLPLPRPTTLPALFLPQSRPPRSLSQLAVAVALLAPLPVVLLAPLPVVLAVPEGPVALVAFVFPVAMVAALQLQLQVEPILLLAPVLAPAAVEDEVVPALPEAVVVFVFVSEAVAVLFNFTAAL